MTDERAYILAHYSGRLPTATERLCGTCRKAYGRDNTYHCGEGLLPIQSDGSDCPYHKPIKPDGRRRPDDS